MYAARFFLFVSLIGAMIACDREPQADYIIVNGAIYTSDTLRPKVEAVAVKGETIAFVGSAEEARAFAGAGCRELDLQGRAMTSGFIESHGHLLSLGRHKLDVDLTTTGSYEELLQAVAKAVERAEPGAWIIGRGWHQSKWSPAPHPMISGFQTHDKLSAITPNNPVYLRHASGHAAIANAKAMELAGVDAATEFADGGEIIKDASGAPTGIFTENAAELIARHIPEASPDRDRAALKLAIEECVHHGITSFQDAGSDQNAIDLIEHFARSDQLPIRVWLMVDGSSDTLVQRWLHTGPRIDSQRQRLTIRAIKLVADGALGSRGAWLLEPYTDRPGHTGHATIPMERVYQVARAALERGFQVCTHAIGDRANREALDQYERALQEIPQRADDHRFRIEHAQHLHPDDIPRFAELGVIASMQGIHMASDRPWAIDRLGNERIVAGAYVWQKLLQSGAMIINGTDVPVEPIDPIASFYASVSRRTLQGTPPGGYEADQKMTREQALLTYTLNAAFGAFEDHIKGSIEVGKLADFTIWSQDLMQVPLERLLETQAETVIIGGAVVFDRNAN